MIAGVFCISQIYIKCLIQNCDKIISVNDKFKSMKFKDLEIGDRFTVPSWNKSWDRNPLNMPGQYGIKLSEMVYEVRSGKENPRLIETAYNAGTISTPTWIDSDLEVEVLPKLQRSFGANNCLPVVGQEIWFYDEHIGGSPSLYCNVRQGKIYKVFQQTCQILEFNSEGNSGVFTLHVCAIYDHKPEIKEEEVDEFFGKYIDTVLI